MKKFLTIVLLFFVIRIQAQERIGEAEAFATAESFLQQQAKQQSSEFSLNEIICSKESGQPNLFLYAMEPQGFVIVSAIGEVLAYSFESDFPASSELPSHINYWLELYNDRTDYLLQHPEQFKEPTRSTKAVEPLLTSCWGQGCFHNEACPKDDHGPCGRVSAGCVAIAMAQIMYYHKRPLIGEGSVSYFCSPYGTLSANFGTTAYQWDEMADTLHRSNLAVAQLVYHCGVSVKMQYSAHQSSSSNSEAINALRLFFSYPGSTLSRRINYNDEEWLAMIMEDLDKQHPVYYSGSSSLGAHAFVCDGYNHDGLFHFNFGWDGVADGYYTLENPFDFSNGQAIIHNIFPINQIPINSDEHGIIYVSPDGTGDGSSWEQATSELQLAIYMSYNGNYTIWVKEGNYFGPYAGKYAFNFVRDCKLYGGFKGDEPFNYDLSLRDFEAHPSVLDGNHTQGVINVLTFSQNECVIIDGFTIQNGKASQGGGLRLANTVTVKNCKICHNYSNTNGGGMAQISKYNSGPITVEDCEFFGNEARTTGGAIFDYGNATYRRCNIHDNTAKQSGGGIHCSTIDPSCYVNCTVSNNIAPNGGGIYTTGGGQTYWSCLISNNTANTGGGFSMGFGNKIYNCTIVKNEALADYGGVNNSKTPEQNEIQNCIIWGNVSEGEHAQIGPSEYYSYCAVQDDQSQTESSNFNADAENDGEEASFYVRFQNADVAAGSTGHGDWHLYPNSLCIDRVDNIVGQPFTDLEGNLRKRHKNVDLGAYESDVVSHIITAYYCEDYPYYYQDSLLPYYGNYTFLYHDHPYDSLVIIQMQVPPPTVFITDVICDEETYDFYGTTLTQPGTYYTTIRCVTYKLNLSKRSSITYHMEKDICEGEIFDFFGTPLQEAGHYTTTTDDCKTYELDLTVNPNSHVPIYMEDEICEGEFYSFFGRHLYNAGYYATTVNCIDHELSLTVNPRPILRCSNDTVVEYGNIIQLSASGAEFYLWSTGDTTQTITVCPLVDKTYSVTGFSESGCSSTASVKVRIANAAEEMVLYPNPANDEVEIYMPLLDEVEVFNLLGEPIERVMANRQPVRLNVRHYGSGVYIVHARQLHNYFYKKLIISH